MAARDFQTVNAPTNRDRRTTIKSRYTLMPVSMLVSCEKCGYENFPQHRFCGMCGAELRVPGATGAQPGPAPRRVPSAPVPPPREAVPQQVSGPSFLGLGNESAETKSVSYLLEDEPAPSHRGRYLLLLVLLLGVAGAGWHWRQALGPLAAKLSSHIAGANTQPNSSAPGVPDSSAEAASATSVSPATQVEKPSMGTSAQADTQAPAGSAQTPPSAPPATTAVSSAADSAQSPQPDQSQPSNQPQPSDSSSAAGVPKPDQSGEAASQPAPAVRPPKVRTRPATASATGTDDLEAEGERYLYGNGVPENCARARKDLLAAAQRSNAKAENVLGTMYATGHCATRDLPNAYRWFGRSLRQDPGNTRIEQDLKVLWNQMTPEEKKLALRDEQ
jgi:hypothetical protein